jgi:hypothetical protein
MKSIYDIIRSTPTKHKVTIKYDNKLIKVTEEQLRWIQYNIAIGQCSKDDVVVVDTNNSEIHFDFIGRLTSPIEGSNAMRFNDDLALGLFDYYKNKKF